MTCAVVGESESDSSDVSLTLHRTEGLATGQDESGSSDEAILEPLPIAINMSLPPELAKMLTIGDGFPKVLTDNNQTIPVPVNRRWKPKLMAGGVPTDALNKMVSLNNFWGLLVLNVLSHSSVCWCQAWRASLYEGDRCHQEDLTNKWHLEFRLRHNVVSGENVTHQRTTFALPDGVLHLEFAGQENTEGQMKILNG